MRAIVTVIGRDQVGIIAAVCALLSEKNINVLDISQTVLQEYFTMIMLVDASQATVPFARLREDLTQAGKERGRDLRTLRVDICDAMHLICACRRGQRGALGASATQRRPSRRQDLGPERGRGRAAERPGHQPETEGKQPGVLAASQRDNI